MASILIVDDDEDFATATATVLQSAGHELQVELDIDSGKQAMLEKPPDLLILDVMFPEDSLAGFDLARTMRGDEKLRNIPILMLTAVNVRLPLGFGKQDIDDEWMPVSGFLEKPIDLDVLKAKVNGLLKKAR